MSSATVFKETVSLPARFFLFQISLKLNNIFVQLKEMCKRFAKLSRGVEELSRMGGLLERGVRCPWRRAEV